MTSWQTEVMLRNPSAWYPLGDASTTMADASGHGRNGAHTASGVASGAGLLPGDTNLASYYSGSGVSTVVSAAWMDTTHVAVGCWFRLPNVSGEHLLVARDNNGADLRWRLDTTGAQLRWIVNVGGLQVVTSAAILSPTTNYVAFATYDGTTARLYLGSTQVGSLAVAGSIVVGGTREIRLGNLSTGAAPMAGPISNAVIFPDSISAGDVTTLAGSSWILPPGTPTSLILDPDEESIDTSWTASSGTVTGYTMTVNGGTPIDVGNVTSYSLSGLTPETLYEIEVRAYNDGGPSGALSGSTTTLAPPPTDNRLIWNTPENRFFETGLDRGVLYPKIGPAAAWSGLISVDEAGGDGAKAYFADGRPFLFLPVPKEYKATLSAYTYPDAFSAIMGVAEITDGMYLDSQPGAAFDLCYRTLVGNGIDGVEHGYKLHLVYNATVTPQTMNYESMSGSINPSTMSWEIQAVPVKVEGFRPTAHIIIDTRHMDPAKIAAIEALLYGSLGVLAAMPAPQVIFDLLNYGDAIIVTDNGDGTFTVEGSYENVYMLDDGVFRVDNVDGTDNGDGTFTISTTEG